MFALVSKKLAVVSALAALIVLAACSSRTSVESDLGIKGAPDWVNEGSQALRDGKKRYFRGIGSAPAMNDASLQKSTADNRARAELAQVFNSYLDVVAKDYSASVSDGEAAINEQAVSRTIKNSTQMNLSGAEIIARWQDPRSGIIYSLAELDLNKLKTLSAASKEMDARLQGFVNQKAENIFDSISQEK